MSDLAADESRLTAEIERLKADFPKTRELYREACALLFFRFGITPTANRLYQLVRKGSMSTPTAVLGEFWAELREKSRVRIEHPDLPADLQAAAGELVAALWNRSSADAAGALDALRAEVEAERVAAKAEVAAMQAELARTETAEQRTAALLAAQVRIQELEQARAADDASRQALQADIERLTADNAEGDRALRRRGRTSLPSSTGCATTPAGPSACARRKRALQEIDRERLAARLQKELEAAALRMEQRDAAAQEMPHCRRSSATRCIDAACFKGSSTARWRPMRHGARNSMRCGEMTALSRRSALRGAKAAPAAQRDERRARSRKRADEAPPR